MPPSRYRSAVYRIYSFLLIPRTGTDDGIGGASSYYAVNSWLDIEFETPGKTRTFGGTMYCTEDYSAVTPINNVAQNCTLCHSPSDLPIILHSDNEAMMQLVRMCLLSVTKDAKLVVVAVSEKE